MESDVTAAFLFICQRNLISLIALGGCNFDVALFVSTAGTIKFLWMCVAESSFKKFAQTGQTSQKYILNQGGGE